MNSLKLVSISFLIIGMAACNSANPEYVASVEQLSDNLKINKKDLSFDIAPFEARVEEISTNLTRLKTEYTDTLTMEEGITFDKYKGVMKIYKRNIKLYDECSKTQKELEIQISNLLEDLKKGRLTDEEFKGYFATEKADIDLLIEQTNLIKSSTYELEPEFRRLSKEIYAKLPVEGS